MNGVSKTVIRQLCIIGVGLIGGSLARALRKAGACGQIVGCGRSLYNLQKALALGVVDRFDTEVGRAVLGADMVVVAVPLGAMETIFKNLQGKLAPDAVITDAGSAKQCVLAWARAVFGEVPANLVPGHPVAGTEKSGVEASFDTLFAGRRVILTPTFHTDPAATARVRAMWETVGAEVVEMDAGRHDELLAATSHLPQILAYTLAEALRAKDENQRFWEHAGGGLRDLTRIASSDPQMWHDICLNNRDAILETLADFGRHLESVTQAIRQKDGETLKALFERAKEYRDRYLRMT